MVVAILAIMLTLVFVIGIHEVGHAIAARAFKIKIKRIALGFGKPLMQWQSSSGCEWVLGRWFLGGYVELNNTRISPVATEQHDSCFDKKPIWQRVVVLIAGAGANVLTAWVAFTLVFSIGIHYRIPQVQTVEANSVAAKLGIKPQDQWLSLAGHLTRSWTDVGQELILHWGEENIPASLKESSGQVKNIFLDLSQIPFSARPKSLLASIGVSPNKTAGEHIFQSPTFLMAMQEAAVKIVSLVSFLLLTLKQIIIGVIPISVLLGPIGLLATSVASLTQGTVAFIYFIATLSVAVALLNLFPIPGLDGGSILYAFIEKVRGKPISIALELLIYRLMLVAFFLLLVQLIKNDVVSFFLRSAA